jgi:hypothetical protein
MFLLNFLMLFIYDKLIKTYKNKLYSLYFIVYLLKRLSFPSITSFFFITSIKIFFILYFQLKSVKKSEIDISECYGRFFFNT